LSHEDDKFSNKFHFQFKSTHSQESASVAIAQTHFESHDFASGFCFFIISYVTVELIISLFLAFLAEEV